MLVLYYPGLLCVLLKGESRIDQGLLVGYGLIPSVMVVAMSLSQCPQGGYEPHQFVRLWAWRHE